MCEEGLITVKWPHSRSQPQLEPEEEKMSRLVSQLQAHYGTSYDVRASSSDSSHYSPFTGGGAIYISMKEPGTTISAVLLAQQRSDQEPPPNVAPAGPQPVVTPLKQGELIICGAVERKGVRAQLTPHKVTLQLHADMLLLCERTLEKLVTATPRDVESLKVLSCYGIQMDCTTRKNS